MTSDENLTRRDKGARQTIELADIADGRKKLPRDPELLSRIAVKWCPDGHKERISDVGSYCFRIRHGSGQYISVDESSLIRHPLLVPIVHCCILEMARTRNPKDQIALRQLTLVLSADDDGLLKNGASLFGATIAGLRAKINERQMKRTSAKNLQSLTIRILCRAFEISAEELTSGCRLIRDKRQSPDDTTPLSVEAGIEIANAAADHFTEIVRILTNNIALPTTIVVSGRKFLVCAAPRQMPGSCRYIRLDDSGAPPPDSPYGPDLKLKKQSSPKSLPDGSAKQVRTAQRNYSATTREHNSIEKANESPYSPARMRLASEATLSFLILTYFDSGANPTQLHGQVRDGDIEDAIQLNDLVDTNGKTKLERRRREGFVLKRLKRRAGNKEINILFSSVWVRRMFPAYLGLREFLEKSGIESPNALLFFLAIGRSFEREIDLYPKIYNRLRTNRHHLIHSYLAKHNLSSISASQIRNFKAVALATNSSLRTSAGVLGHSVETAKRNYHRAAERDAQQQISDALDTISSIAILRRKHASEMTQFERLGAGGACTKPEDAPSIESDDQSLGLFNPSCKTRAGCWLCEHFAVHADKEDLWKMKSYLSVLDEIRLCSTEQHTVSIVQKPIVERISAVCEQISSMSPELERMANKVDLLVARGELHPSYKTVVETYELVGFM